MDMEDARVLLNRARRHMDGHIIMDGVSEYCEGYAVSLVIAENGRLVVAADNEGGHNGTHVDLKQLIAWLKIHRPELLEENI